MKYILLIFLICLLSSCFDKVIVRNIRDGQKDKWIDHKGIWREGDTIITRQIIGDSLAIDYFVVEKVIK